MADYISRDYTVENMENYPWDTEHDKNVAIHLVRELVPAADVRPVMRGKWIKYAPHNSDMMTCSECEKYWILDGDQYEFNFCPTCGADMREVKVDGN